MSSSKSSRRHGHHKQRTNVYDDDRHPKEEKSVHDFNFNSFRWNLNKMFFGPKDRIKMNSREYEDFWVFLKKYQEKLKNSKKDSFGPINEKVQSLMKKLEIEGWNDIENLMKFKGSIFNDCQEKKEKLTLDSVEYFRNIVVLYLDFLDKQKERTLRKLQEQKDNLPIAKFKHEIIEKIRDNSVVLISGDTGSGKSTQVPQYLIEAGYQKIACSQPRRIACISLAKRVAYETNNVFGDEIGYQIRFDQNRTDSTKVLFLTEGLLLRQITTDPLLSSYDVIILDEIHER